MVLQCKWTKDERNWMCDRGTCSGSRRTQLKRTHVIGGKRNTPSRFVTLAEMIQGQIMNIHICKHCGSKRRMWEIAILSAYKTNQGTYNIFSRRHIWPNSLVEFTSWSLCDDYWRRGFDSPGCFCFNFNFFPLQELNSTKPSAKDLYLFFATRRIYIFRHQ